MSKKRIDTEIIKEQKGGMPDTVSEMVNRYGTYEIQATADTENMYPAISQGYNKKIIETDCTDNGDPNKKAPPMEYPSKK